MGSARQGRNDPLAAERGCGAGPPSPGRQLDDEDNLQVTIDFRRVYSSLLEQWMGTDATAVIPNSSGFGRVALVT